MCFDEVKMKLGFGCMRLPMADGEVDKSEFCRMIDTFLENGFNYFDTAHMYVDGKSEYSLAECLVARHPRDSYVLVDKLSQSYFNTEDEVRPFFEEQLKILGVEYLDFYLMHAQNATNFEKYKKCRAYEIAMELKAEGKIRHMGISFHDKAAVLDRILTEYPAIEVVQIQFNYLDLEDPSVESRKCYEVCRKHNKPIIIMEPVKGGKLAKLPEGGDAVLAEVGTDSPAGYAIRFAASFEGVMMVLSGMSNMAQMTDNIERMRDFKPLNDAEYAALRKLVDLYHKEDQIPCTNCRYCVPGCPKQIAIPDLFTHLNDRILTGDEKYDAMYRASIAQGGAASDCIKCGKCEDACPQHLPIRRLLRRVASTFGK